MRTHLVRAIVALIPACLTIPANAQDAAKIVDQYIKAEGGSKTLSKVNTLKLEGTFASTANETVGTYTLITKQSNRYYSELVDSDRTSIEAYNGKSAWHQNAGEPATLVGAEGAQLEAAGQYYNSRLVNAKKNKLGIAFIGHSQVRGNDTLQIEVTTSAGLKREIFFDPQTHLIVKEAAPIGGIDEQMLYDDYRAQGGVKLPFKIELHRGNDVYNVTVTRAVVNGTVGERVFDFPKKSQVQLPDLKALFKEIDDNQKTVDKIKENYAGTRTEEETEYDKTGRVTKHEAKEYTFFYFDGDELSTLIGKDGKPLGEEELKKENDKTQKEIRQHEAKKEAKETKEAKESKDPKEKDNGKKDNEDPGIEVFLRVSQFVNPRRERFRGQDVLVFDFEPNPEYKAHKLEEKVVQKLAGVIWIDEKSHDVARLEAYFVGDFKLAGGMVANLQKGTSFVFEQAFINNEVWLPTYAEAHVGVRVLLVKGFKINVVIRYSDYKRFNVESISTVGKAKGSTDAPANAPAEHPHPPEPQ
jgi:hypothetical protein